MAASEKRPLSALASSSTAASSNGGSHSDSSSSSSSAKGKGKSTGDDFLDALVEVFPQLNFLTLVEVCMDYKNDIDGAAEYIIQNVLPSILDDNSANANDDSHMKGPASIDNNAHIDSVEFDMANKYTADEHEDSLTGEKSIQFSSSEQDCVVGGHNHDCLVTSAEDSKPETSTSEDDLATHDDRLPDLTLQSSCFVRLESLDNSIAAENNNKVTLMSNIAAISQMLEDVELKEDKSKRVVLEATQAGNDILVKVEELKEMTMLVAEENEKVAGEVCAEQSILASEAHGLQARLSNVSQERNHNILIIDEMLHTLQRRLAMVEMEIVEAEKEKIERETLAEKMLHEQELLFDATKEKSNKLKQQAHENTKLRELLMDRGQIVDALQGEMIGIFDKISQLQLKVDMKLSKSLQASSSISSSAKSVDDITQLHCRVDEPQRLNDEPLQPASPRLPLSSVKSTDNISQAYCRIDESRLFINEHQLLVGEPELPIDEGSQLASSILSSSLKSTDTIAQLLGKVLDVNFPLEKSLQVASSSLCSSMKSTDDIEHLQCKVDVAEPLQLPSSTLASLDKSTTSKSWSSAVESNSVFSGDEEIDDASSHGNLDLDDSWDVVDDEVIYTCAN